MIIYESERNLMYYIYSRMVDGFGSEELVVILIKRRQVERSMHKYRCITYIHITSDKTIQDCWKH